MGQQSLAEFMGLRVDIPRIAAENKVRQGIRKCGFLVNQGGKLTRQERQVLIEQNRKRYGLTEEQIEEIKLPPPCHVEIYDMQKIINAKSKLSVVEKINHFLKLQEALISKLEHVRHNKKKLVVAVSSGTTKDTVTTEDKVSDTEERVPEEELKMARDMVQKMQMRAGQADEVDEVMEIIPNKRRRVID